jgi:Brp/Blh family beta-carotene 15,15'-monooxygenase
MSAEKLQGSIFCAMAVPLSMATILLKQPNQRTELIALALLIVMLGVPHGALDLIFAKDLYRVQTLTSWLRFGLAYLIPVVLVLSLWRAAPTLFLLGFLIISMVHFSGDPAAGTPVWVRVFYGGIIIFLPAFRHSEEVRRLFSTLAGSGAAECLTPVLSALAWPWVIGSLMAAVCCCKDSDWLTGMEILSLALAAALAAPLVAFTVYFCGMHSARHVLRTIYYSEGSSVRLILAAALAPMFVFLALFFGAFIWLREIPLEARLVQLIFVALAALTVPHMALIERVRFAGWTRKPLYSERRFKGVSTR